MKLSEIFSDLLRLIYPELCVACANPLFQGEHILCTFCRVRLPYTNDHIEKDNKVTKLFWGRVKVESAASFLYFKKGTKVQRLLHQLKYKGRKDVGIKLGELFGKRLVESPHFLFVDLIIPVPLHPTKLKRRGYNQAAAFAEGLAKGMNIRMDETAIFRKKYTETQTRKARYDRFMNVNEVFDLKNSESLKSLHILLVDDVITTGSTIEACAEQLLKIEGVKLSVATIASAG